jgi:hypothetical protein
LLLYSNVLSDFSNLIDFHGQSISKLLQLLLFYFFQIIGVAFLEKVEDIKEDTESQNSHIVVEAKVDEIPLTSGFDSLML